MATPINKLKKAAPPSESENGNELIDDVLKAVSGENGSSNSAPIAKEEECSVNSSDTHSSNNEQLIKSALKTANNTNNKDMLSSIEASEQADKMIDQMLGANRNKRNLTERLVDEIREPLLVMVLFVIFNTGFFSNLLKNYLGKYLTSGNELNYFGMFAHTLVFGLVYYVLKKLLA